jgi:hypothetical protein
LRTAKEFLVWTWEAAESLNGQGLSRQRIGVLTSFGPELARQFDERPVSAKDRNKYHRSGL